MPETCTRCGEDYPLSQVIIYEVLGEREVICPECSEPEDRIVRARSHSNQDIGGRR